MKKWKAYRRRAITLRWIYKAEVARSIRADNVKSLLLADWAEPRTSPTLYDTPDRAPIFMMADLPLSPVNMKARGKIAKIAIGLRKIS